MTMQFPNESDLYRVARNKLLEQELALRREMEAVAMARRALPPGGLLLEDYVFQGRRGDGTTGDVRLSEQFTSGDTLVVYNFMFPRSRNDDRLGPQVGATAELPLHEGPCPSCTALLDQLDRAVRHLAHRLNVVVVAKTSIERLETFAAERGWQHLRLLSAANNSFKRDYGGEDPDGSPEPMLNVFMRSVDGIRHTWSCELLHAPIDPGQEMRHVGTIEPMWNLLDFTPDGRGPEEEQLQYGCCAPARQAQDQVNSGPTSERKIMPISDQTAIRTQFEERARALYNKDAKAAVRHYAEDIVNFDLAPPLAQRGREATDPAVLNGWFDSWDGPIGIAFEQVQVRAAAGLAFAFGFLHMTGRRTDGSQTDVWARFTVCLERRGEAWKIVHEHQSFPTRMDGSGKSASDLKP